LTHAQNKRDTITLYGATPAIDKDDIATTCVQWTRNAAGTAVEAAYGAASGYQTGYIGNGTRTDDGIHISGRVDTICGAIYYVRVVAWFLKGPKWTPCGSPRDDETWSVITMAPAFNQFVIVDPPATDTSFNAHAGVDTPFILGQMDGHIDHDTTPTDEQTDQI